MAEGFWGLGLKLCEWPRVWQGCDWFVVRGRGGICGTDGKVCGWSATGLADIMARGCEARSVRTAAGRGDTAPVVCGWAHRVCFVSRRIGRWWEAAPGWSF